MAPEQKLRLRSASLCSKPISAEPIPKQWNEARSAVLRALKGRNLDAGLRGAVLIESCQEADRHLIRTPISKVNGGAS